MNASLVQMTPRERKESEFALKSFRFIYKESNGKIRKEQYKTMKGHIKRRQYEIVYNFLINRDLHEELGKWKSDLAEYLADEVYRSENE